MGSMPEAGHGRGELSLGILGLLLSALLLISTRWPQAAVIARPALPPHDASAGPDLVARNSHRDRGRFSSPTRGGRYSWARYYHPMIQRFISEDPIGLVCADLNLYGYVRNAPLNYIDSLGLDREKRGSCTDRCLQTNYGALADYAYNLSYFGVFTPSVLEGCWRQCRCQGRTRCRRGGWCELRRQRLRHQGRGHLVDTAFPVRSVRHLRARSGGERSVCRVRALRGSCPPRAVIADE